MRINKLLSNFGLCSRREANRWIESERVLVNGSLCKPGQWVEASDEILIDGNPIEEKKKIYIALNKPIGIVCTAAEEVKENIINFMNLQEYIFPVGRLDKESEGLILMTNDGEFANKILAADNYHEKEYIVRVDKKLTDEFLKGMSQGVKILNTLTRPCRLEKIDDYSFNIILTQGLNRQIRRMVKTFGYNVMNLKRVRILSIELQGLGVGQWRYLTNEEMRKIKNNL